MKAIVLALLLVSIPAHAEDACQCVNHPERTFPAGPNGDCESADHSICNDSTSGGGVNPAVSKGAVNFFGAIAFLIEVTILPGHATEMMATDKSKFQTAAQAHAEYAKYIAHRDAVEKAGRDAETSRAAMSRIEAAEYADAARTVTASLNVPVAFPAPHLKPDEGMQCRQALMLVTEVHRPGEIGAFANEETFKGRCEQFALPSSPPDPSCSPTTSRRCGLQPEVCCPLDQPIFNACDGQCYHDTNFLKTSKDLECIHATPHDCATFNPTKP